MSNSNAEDVREFTVESGTECPLTPVAMNRESVKFIIRMVMSELDELACTVTSDKTEKESLMTDSFVTRDQCSQYHYPTNESLIAAQFDALVDSWYYSLNIAAKHGTNMSKIFDVVHGANMDKRDPTTGLFLKREDGKIIKPLGWKSPDIDEEIRRQIEEGGFPSKY